LIIFFKSEDVNPIEETQSIVWNEKIERETPPAQLTPANPIYTTPSPSTNAVLPHYYPTHPPHHNIIYPP
jgi:hypothetical protein